MLKSSLGALLLFSACSIGTDAFGMWEREFGDVKVRIVVGPGYPQYQPEPPKEQPPKNFRGSIYLSLNPDLQEVVKTKKDPTSWARRHYMAHGRYEGRHYLPRDFNGETYISLYPDLQSASANRKPHKRESWGREHYAKHGYKEDRLYSAGAQPLPKLRYYKKLAKKLLKVTIGLE